jgi:ABC-type sugar transport system substrate-binding protein
MNPRLVLVVVSLVLSLAIGLVVARSGAGGGEAKRGRPLIGLSMDTLKEERWQVDRDLFLERAKALGVDVLVQSANSDDSVQLTQVQSLITQGVDALVIIPHNGEAMAKAVALAHAAGVPVLSYDRLITGCDLDLYITFDNVKVGELQARFLAERIPEGGKLRVVRIYGSKTDNNAVLFKQGQDNVLKPLIEAGKVEVVFEDWAADWKPENAKKIMNAAITKSGPGIDAVLASNDGTAGGAVQVGGVFFLRAVLSPFAHVMFTSLTGFAFGLAARRSLRTGAAFRYALPGLVGAIVLHALWNGSAVFADFFALYATLQVPLFAGFVGGFIALRREEARLTRERLGEYADIVRTVRGIGYRFDL